VYYLVEMEEPVMRAIGKILTLAAASSCLLFGATGIAAGSAKDLSGQGAQASSCSQKGSLLFAIKVKQAKLSHSKGREYTLSFNPSSIIDGVLAFSDRPTRKAYRITFTDYSNLVSQGEDSFKKDPPNIVLNWGGSNGAPQAYQILSVGSDTNGLHQLTLRGIDDSMVPQGGERTGQVDAFIDGITENAPSGIGPLSPESTEEVTTPIPKGQAPILPGVGTPQ
jgi:hypothetical protein